MSTLVKASTSEERSTERGSHARTARRYAITAAGCALFALIYAQFSHGVYSPFMTFMFAIPLIGGALPALILGLAKASPLPVRSRQTWALALATLTVASCLRGIFEIAGTSSPFLMAYVVVAAAFALAAAITLIRSSRS